jgi:hypothetical protein
MLNEHFKEKRRLGLSEDRQRSAMPAGLIFPVEPTMTC